MRQERFFKSDIKKILKKRYPGSIILNLDPNDIQGIPDMLILFNNKWAALEFKRHNSSSKRPNQEYYVNKMSSMSYANFINPNNVDNILNDLDSHFEI